MNAAAAYLWAIAYVLAFCVGIGSLIGWLA